MIPADPVAFAKWCNDARTRVAQVVLLDARDRARAEGQYVKEPEGRRLRLLLDEVDHAYRIAQARERDGVKPMTRGEFREFAEAMFGGRLHRRPHVGWVLDLEPEAVIAA